MKIQHYNTLERDREEALFRIWNSEYPSALVQPDFLSFKQHLSHIVFEKHLLAIDERGAIAGWLALFEREHAPWFLMMLHRLYQGQGIGSLLLSEAKQLRPELNGWAIPITSYQKADGSPYPSPIGFYEKNGFEILHHIQGNPEPIKVVKIKWTRA